MSIRLCFRLFTYEGRQLPKSPQKSGFQRVSTDTLWSINDNNELVAYFHEMELADAIIGLLEQKYPQMKFQFSVMFQGVSYEQ